MQLYRIELVGSSVTLRPLELTDAEQLARAASESRETYGYTQVPNGVEEASAYIERSFRFRASGLNYAFVILWHGRLVGTTGFWDYYQWEWPAGCVHQRRDSPDVVEIGGTWLAASAQRTSCNTESKLLLLKHAFEIWRVHRVSLRTDERNSRCRRAIERLGAKFEGIRRADLPGEDCTLRNSAYYSIVVDEWPDVRRDLIRRLDGSGPGTAAW